MPKAKEKSITVPEEEEVIKIEEDEPEKDTVGHGMINPIEAKHHMQRLDEALQSMMMKLNSGKIKDILKDTLKEFQEARTILIPSVSDSNLITVLRTIKTQHAQPYVHRQKKLRVSWRNTCQMKTYPQDSKC